MQVMNGAIYDMNGRPLVDKAAIELDEEPGVVAWGGYFRLPPQAPPLHVFKPQCVLKLADGRQGTVSIGRTDRAGAYFLGKGKLEKPKAA